jgi:hypothetical protein
MRIKIPADASAARGTPSLSGATNHSWRRYTAALNVLSTRMARVFYSGAMVMRPFMLGWSGSNIRLFLFFSRLSSWTFGRLS